MMNDVPPSPVTALRPDVSCFWFYAGAAFFAASRLPLPMIWRFRLAELLPASCMLPVKSLVFQLYNQIRRTKSQTFSFRVFFACFLAAIFLLM
ncbi:MAG: hypothetical protein Q4C60_11060 [Eubacteriales bacterium]|nr:hypothetical protein [Eubacteriales bacterium]